MSIWIDVNERLPKINKDNNYSDEVLVYRSNDTYELAKCCQDYYTKECSWVRSLDYWTLRDVVAWMPVPKINRKDRKGWT